MGASPMKYPASAESYLFIQLLSLTPAEHQMLPRWNHSSGVVPGGLENDQQAKVINSAIAAEIIRRTSDFDFSKCSEVSTLVESVFTTSTL